MHHRRLGRTALPVSELCLGTMNFGPQTPEDESCAIMDRALELGINFFDTANGYGGDKGAGPTEQIVGRWFAQGGGGARRSCWRPSCSARCPSGRTTAGCRPATSAIACDASLRRLQTDHIDLYQMHHIDRTRAVGRGVAGDGDARRSRARSSTSAAATSPAGTSPRPTRRPRPAALPRPGQRAEPLQPARRARSSSRCCRRAATTASG